MCVKDSNPSELPEGFSYRSEFLSIQEEEELLRHFQHLEFHAFNFQGYIAKRRIIEYGFEYDFTSRRATAAQSIPEFLKPFQKRAAMWAGFGPQDIVEAVITEYTTGAPIGWHRDVPQFEMIIGISLNSSCRMRFKPYKREGKIVSLTLEPRSAYLMRGAARWKYQHSIPASTALRYSITFRTLRKSRARMSSH
jgi:alkylated DNA repair dioxygenase AlkB